MNDTIAAISTAYGEGGIGIVRISGPDSYRILSSVFDGKILNRRMSYGYIRNQNKTVDEVLAVFMRAPNTYTAEDTVEINCHGSMISLQKTLELVLSKGARMAEPGEFTKRAFLNGRLNLSQAEAVIDLIKAKTDDGFDIAMSHLEGQLSERVSELRHRLMDVLVDVTVNIDYPDEDIEELTYEKLRNCLCSIKNEVIEYINSYEYGRIIKEGIRIAIIGKPNVGKSSLLNSLLRCSRAIVTEIPGTTRDAIEENVNIRGIPVRLVDTAGIRETDDAVESIGIERSKGAFNSADYIVFMVDGSKPLDPDDMDIISALRGKRALVVVNKSDLGFGIDESSLEESLHEHEVEYELIHASIVSDQGVSEIENNIESLVKSGQVFQANSVVIDNARHKDLLCKTRKSLEDALGLIDFREALDIIEIDIRNAYDFLGEIIGESVSDDIIDEVFARFCLGK